MTEMMAIIAETEGIKTPTRKRTKAEVEKAYDEFVKTKAEKKAAKPSTGSLSQTEKRKAAKKDTAPKPVTVYVDPIDMTFVSTDEYVRMAGFDKKSKQIHVSFAKSTWALPSNAKEWKGFEDAIADPNINASSYYRTAFRGRTAEMLPVNPKSEVTA